MTQDKERGGGIADFRVGFGATSVAGGANRDERLRSEDGLLDESTPGSFRILAVGEFSPRGDYTADAARSRKAVPVTIATFDEVMASFDVKLMIEVPGVSDATGKPLRAPLAFKRLRSFRPDVLVQEVDAFRLIHEEAPAPLAATASAPAAEGKSLIADILGSMSEANAPGPRPRGASERSKQQKAQLLGGILGHPEVRRLERAWRGLKLLVERAAKGGVSIELVDARPEDVETAIVAAARESDQGAVDLIVVDYEIGANARDLDMAERWAQVAEAIPAPLVTNAAAEVIGFEDLEQLAQTSRRVRNLDGPRATLFRALTEKDCTRWLLFAMNGFILRHAHTNETVSTGGIALSENAPLFGGAAWLVACAAASAFQGCGWASALTDPKYRTIVDLNVQMLDDRGSNVSVATESFVSLDLAGEAAAAGVSVVTAVADRDVAAIPFARMVYRGRVGVDGARGAAELSLGDQLFVARLFPFVTEIAAVIPHGSDESAVRDTARIALLSLFATNGEKGPLVDAKVRRDAPVLDVTIRPRGFHGVRVSEFTLSARLG